MTAIQTFNFDGATVRTVIDENGDTLFVGKDVCDVLGYTNPAKAMGDHCKGVTKRYPLQTLGGMQDLRVLGESDVMRLIIRSKLPAAEKFEVWVFEEVLPTIRKTGSYGAAPARDPIEVLNDPVAMRGLLLTYAEKVLALEATSERQAEQIRVEAPKVVYAEALLGSDDDMLLREACKIIGFPERQTRAALKEHGVLLKDGAPAAHYVTMGYFRLRPSKPFDTATMKGCISLTLRVTTKGLEFLRRFMSRRPPQPRGYDRTSANPGGLQS